MGWLTYYRHRKLLERHPDRLIDGYGRGYFRGLRVGHYGIPLPAEHAGLLRRAEYGQGSGTA